METVKTENVGYLKSAINLQTGVLKLENKQLSLSAKRATLYGFGLIGLLLQKWLAKENEVFNMPLSDINSVEPATHGINKNVIKITDKRGIDYKLIVKNKEEWIALLMA